MTELNGMQQLLQRITDVLGKTGEPTQNFEQALGLVLGELKSETGTIHRLDEPGQELHLLAQIGLPPQLLAVIKVIPVGKGIAGQTVVMNQPVRICNLQTDKSGVTKPGAKQTGVGGALSVPIRAAGKVVGTLGIGTMRQYEYSEEETRLLEEVAAVMGKYL